MPLGPTDIRPFHFPNSLALFTLGASYAVYFFLTLIKDTCTTTRVTGGLISVSLLLSLPYLQHCQNRSISLNRAVLLLWTYNLVIYSLIVLPDYISKPECAAANYINLATNETVSRFQFAGDISLSAVSATTPHVLSVYIPSCLRCGPCREPYRAAIYLVLVLALFYGSQVLSHSFPEQTMGFAACIPQLVNFGLVYTPDQFAFQPISSSKRANIVACIFAVLATCAVLTFEALGHRVPLYWRLLCTAVFSTMFGFATQMALKGDKTRAEPLIRALNADHGLHPEEVVVDKRPPVHTRDTTYQGQVTQESTLGRRRRRRR